MLESLVSTLLNRVLGAYVSNLNYNQLQIGIWSGEVVLRDLKLKREALDKLDLPIDVIEGHLGELTLNIPWSNLKGKPVMVSIKDVYVLAGPRSDKNTTEELKQREHQRKMRKLANAELLHETTPNNAKNDTFIDQLSTKILNNLQFSVTGIHVRYEDNVSCPGHRFAAGVTLSELSAISTDENWIPQTIDSAVNTIHKLATLESLTVYWDTDTESVASSTGKDSLKLFKDMIATKSHTPSEHQYILKPVSGTGRLKLNKNFGQDTPKVDATLLFDELSFIVDDEQYRDAVLLIDLFHSYLKKQKYQHMHPPPHVTPRTNPRAYFKFAAEAVRSEIHDRHYQWTWDHFRQRRDDRLAYIRCYVDDQLGRASPEDKEQLEQLEWRLSYEDIRFYRSLARGKLKRERAILEERKRKELAEAQKNTTTGWLSSWWYGSAENTGNAQENEDLVITEEQKQEFYDAIEYDEDKAAAASAVEISKDTKLFALCMTLNRGSFTVRRKPHATPVDVVSLVFDTVVMGGIQYHEGIKASVALGDLQLFDGVTPNTRYKQLVGAKQDASQNQDGRRMSNLDPVLLQSVNMDDPFFSFVFEHKPLDGRADNAMALMMRNIDIVYNPYIIREVLEFFRPPSTSTDSIKALIEVAGDTLEDIKNQTRVGLQFALEQHTTLDLRVDMDAPVIVIPEDCTLPDCRGIVVDAGHINVESNLAPPEIVQQMKSKRSMDYTSDDFARLRSLMYDRFDVHLTQTKILTGDSVNQCLEQVRRPQEQYNYLHLVNRIDMTFLVEMCIVHQSNDLTNFKISGQLPLLAVNFSDTKYRILMQLPHLIDASGLLGHEDKEGEKPQEAISPETARLMHTRLWRHAEKELLLDSDDSDSESDDLSDVETAQETLDTDVSNALASSARSTNSGRSVVPNTQQKQFELDFRVDKVSANILEAHGDHEVLLCDLVLQHLAVHYTMRPYDMLVNVSLKSLDVTDRMEHGDEFKYLITSDQDVLHGRTHEETKDLVHVEYVRVDRTSPEYLSKYKSIDQTAKVTLSTLNFIVTRSSVLTLYNFVLNTFVDHNDATPTSNKPVQSDKIVAPQEQSIHVSLLLDSVNFIFNNDGTRLATGELSHCDMTMLLANGTTKVAAKLANLTLTDDLRWTPAKLHDNELLTIQGEELIDFRFETFLQDDTSYPGYDQAVNVKMGSAQFTFLESTIRQLLEYLSKFADMKAVYDRAREAALESAQQLQQSMAKTHFDIVIQTPVVLFPELHRHPRDVVVAHLGEVHASNTFQDEAEGCLNVMDAAIRAINLTSKYYHPKSPDAQQQLQLQTLPMIDNINLNFRIASIHSGEWKNRPEIIIDGQVDDIGMHLTDRQYTFLLDAANMMSRVFAGGDESQAVPSPPPLPSRGGGGSPSTSGTSPPKPKPPVDNTTDAPPRIALGLKAGAIGLDLYMQDPDEPSQSLINLSRIALDDMQLKLDVRKDETMAMHMQIKALTLDDTRPNINSHFKNIVPAIKDGVQLTLQLDISAPEPTRHGIAFLTINDPKMVLSLDHVFHLHTFVMQPFVRQPTPKSPTQQARPGEAEDEGMEIFFCVNVVNPEFILLANPDRKDSEAVVLSANEVIVSKQAVTSLAVRQVGMFLCRMDQRQTSTLRFIQTFDVSLSMNSNCGGDAANPKTEMVVDVDALVLRLSYRDALLITDIFNKAYELYSSSSGTDQAALEPAPSTSYESMATSVNQTLMHEALRASFQGVQIILIEEIHEIPMVDLHLAPFNVDATNWSRSLSVDVGFSTFINYFNIKNSHWEPLVEPWKFKLRLSKRSMQKQEPLHIKLLSSSDLNVNVTHTFMESAVATAQLLDKQKELVYSGERGAVAPYKIRNWTGYTLHLWNASKGTNPTETVIKTLENGADMPWWFEDWRERRETTTKTSNNMLSVQLEGALWESLRNIPVDSQGEHMYSLRPRLDEIQHHIVFDIKLIDNLKVVTIRSAMMIENRTLLPIDVGILDVSGHLVQENKVSPGDNFALPIEQAYLNRFVVRPDAGFGYRWTDQVLHWKDLARNATRVIKCQPEDGDMPPFIFQLNPRMDKKNPLFGVYPCMAVRLSAPVEIENLLPFDFNFRIIDKTAGQDFSSFLRKGGTTPLHVIENGHLLLFNMHMPSTEYSSSEFAIISTRGTDDLNTDDSLQLVNRNNVKLTLKINTIDIPDSGGAKKYSIYCPYVIMNKTGQTIAFKARPAWQNAMFNNNTNLSVCRASDKSEPFMYSYPKLDNRNRSLIQVNGSEWSQPLSFEAVGSVQDVVLGKPNGQDEAHLGISIKEGQGKYKVTKIVTITPRFVLSNKMDEAIRYREPESRHDQLLDPHQRTPLYQLRRNAEKQLTIKLPGINNTWSAPFNLQDIGVVHVRLENAEGATAFLMRVTTVLEDATVFIILSKERDDAWPYKLVNQTNEDITFYQADPVVLRDDFTDDRTMRHRTKRYKLPAHQSVSYSWDMPALKEKKLILNSYGRERSINLQEIGSQLPFRHQGRDGRPVITAIDVKTSKEMQIVYLTPYNQSQSYFRPLSSDSSVSISSASSRETAMREGFETIDVRPVINFVIELRLAQIGVSLVNKHLQEIAYITFRGTELKLTDSNMYQSLRWIIKWVQIDNQLYGTMFPILLYPTNVTKETNQEILPTFQVGLDRVKDDSHGVLYFKYFSILLQEISIEMDEEFIYAILDYTHLDVEGWNTPVDDGKVWELTTEIPDVSPQGDTAQLYFEMLNIQPIGFDLSFLRTDQMNIIDERPQGGSAMMFFVNVLTMAIGNINAAPLRFNALAVENLRASGPDLAQRIFLHYSDQFVYQLHRMLGSADFLGNPVGLFNNLSSGVAELFYEPWQGFIMSDRPQDLGIGIARGFSGFLRKSVFGVTDSFTKFTGSIGKGLSAATMDRQYQDRRRMNMARNRPRHALGGITQGANYFASGLASGMSGLVTRPIEGASKEGVGGFFTGMGKGLVGAVTKPVVGVFDLASNVTEGIRNSATPTDTNDIERIRFPRFIDRDGILRPYSITEAQGQNWLKDVEGGKYFNDQYIAHCLIQQNNERVAMLTSNRILLIRTRRLAVEWQEPFTEIQTIKCEPTGIAIYLRSMSWEPFLVISDKQTRDWFFKKIEEAVLHYHQPLSSQ